VEDQDNDQNSPLTRAIGLVLGIPWFDPIDQALKIGRKLLRRFASEGIYEVLDYECWLELRDTEGTYATIQKREKVRYLQDYITTYQDQAWGNGEILLNYKCSPGVPVDEYRLGHNTCRLISLRNCRSKGDVDEFNIEWSMRNGFLKSTGFWGTSINHRTRMISVQVIFPKGRPPFAASVYEKNSQRTRILGQECKRVLPDGRRMITWENSKPRLYEDYILKWEW
jgi:hypothetical protein